ncbi:MAG TPA: hypothetical protein VFA81_13455 [Burkholderiales bacterium]|nr:hypothetical protein [Burkholderiales bacterium]
MPIKHVEPAQLKSSTVKPARKKSSSWRWGGALLALTLALGWASSTLFGPKAQDQLTSQEIQERQAAFTKERALAVTVVDADQIDAALDGMQLSPYDKAQMRALLTPSGAQQTGAGTTSNAPAANAPTQISSLRLVSVSVWDTDAADGDVVAITSAGYRREVVLSKTVQVVTFPVDSTATVQVTGIRDGGGGITLGLRGPSQELLMPIMSEGQTISLPVLH